MKKDFFSDFKKTKVHLTTMEMGASGWAADTLIPEMVGVPMLFLYLHDVPSGFTKMFGVDKDAFFRLAREGGHFSKGRRQEVRDSLGHLTEELAAGHPIEALDGVSGEEQVAMLLCLYLGETQTLKQAPAREMGGHFVVLRYRPKDDVGCMLRPFYMGHTDARSEVLATTHLLRVVDQVKGIDRRQHPEFFG